MHPSLGTDSEILLIRVKWSPWLESNGPHCQKDPEIADPFLIRPVQRRPSIRVSANEILYNLRRERQQALRLWLSRRMQCAYCLSQSQPKSYPKAQISATQRFGWWPSSERHPRFMPSISLTYLRISKKYILIDMAGGDYGQRHIATVIYIPLTQVYLAF